jgi:hypothetical protein
VSLSDQVITTGGYALPDNTQIKVEAPAPGEKDAGDSGGKSEKSGDPAKPVTKEKE